MESWKTIIIDNEPIAGFSADVHGMVNKNKSDHLDDIENALFAFNKECDKRNINIVFFLGDMFEQKFFVATEALSRISKAIAKIAEKRTVIILPGNHDMSHYDKPDLSLVEVFSHFKNVIIANTDFIIETPNVRFFVSPFSKEPLDHIPSSIKKDKKNVLCGHFGVKGFILNPACMDIDIEDSEAIPMESLKQFDKVFLGHYHGYQKTGNVTYVSAPIQNRHGDENMPHGFVFWDSLTDIEKFVSYENGPSYMTINFAANDIKKALELSNAHLRVKLNTKISPEKVATVYKALLKNHRSVKIDDSEMRKTDNPKLVVLENFEAHGYKDVAKLLRGYLDRVKALDKIPAHLSVDILNTKLQELEEV